MMTLRGSFEGLDKALQQKASESGGGLDKETVEQPEIDFRTKEGLEEFSRECIRLFKDGYEVRRALGFETPRSGGYSNEQADGNFPLRMQYAKLKKSVANLSKKIQNGEEIQEAEIDILRKGYNYLFDYRDRLIAFAQEKGVDVSEGTKNSEVPKEVSPEKEEQTPIPPKEATEVTTEETKRNEIEIHSFKMQALRIKDDIEKLKNSSDTNVHKKDIKLLQTELARVTKRLSLFSEDPSKLKREEIVSANKQFAELRALVRNSATKEETPDENVSNKTQPKTFSDNTLNTQEGTEQDVSTASGQEQEPQKNSDNPIEINSNDELDSTQKSTETIQSVARNIRNEVLSYKDIMYQLKTSHPEITNSVEHEIFVEKLKELEDYLFDEEAISKNHSKVRSLISSLQRQVETLQTKHEVVDEVEPEQKQLEDKRENKNQKLIEDKSEKKKFSQAEVGSVEESLQQQYGFQDDRLKRLEERYGVDAVRKTGDYMAIDGVKLKLENHFRKTNTDDFDVARVQELLASNSANIGLLQKRLESQGMSFEDRLALRNAHREKKKAYEDTYASHLQAIAKKPTIEKVQFWKKEEQPEELVSAETEYQQARAGYEKALYGALAKRRLEGDTLEKSKERMQGYTAGMANRFVLGSVVDKLVIEKKVLTPEFSKDPGDGKVQRTFENLQSFFKKRRKAMRIAGWGWTIGGAVVSGGVAGIGAALLGRTASSAIIGTSTATGAVLGGAFGMRGVKKAEGIRDRGVARMPTRYRPADTIALEAELEKNYKRVEQAGRNQKKWVAAGAVTGAALGALATSNFDEAVDSVTSPTPEQNEPPPEPYHQPPPPEPTTPNSSPNPESFPPIEQQVEVSTPPPPPPSVEEDGFEITTQQAPEEPRVFRKEAMPMLPGELGDFSFEHTITESETVHDALVSAWKEHPELLYGDHVLSMEEVHGKLLQLLDELQHNPELNAELMKEANISSGDINLVYPNEKINLEPLFQYLNYRNF